MSAQGGWQLVEDSYSGWSGESWKKSESTSCGSYCYGDSPDVSRMEPGCVIIDKRALRADELQFRSWIVLDPLVDGMLKDGECDVLDTAGSMIAGALVASGGEYGSMLKLHGAQKSAGKRRGSLDKISIAEHVALWRARGARIGTFNGTEIVWDGAL